MRIFELARYNITEKIIDSWISQISDCGLPIWDCGFHPRPLSNVKGVMEKKKVVHLVPLKFLAEEKYLDFKKKYEEFGIKVVFSLLPRHISDALYSRFNSAKSPYPGHILPYWPSSCGPPVGY